MVICFKVFKNLLHCVWQGMVLVWESYKLDPYVQKLAEAVLNFQEKVKKKNCQNNMWLNK